MCDFLFVPSSAASSLEGPAGGLHSRSTGGKVTLICRWGGCCCGWGRCISGGDVCCCGDGRGWCLRVEGGGGDETRPLLSGCRFGVSGSYRGTQMGLPPSTSHLTSSPGVTGIGGERNGSALVRCSVRRMSFMAASTNSVASHFSCKSFRCGAGAGGGGASGRPANMEPSVWVQSFMTKTALRAWHFGAPTLALNVNAGPMGHVCVWALLWC